MYRLDILILCYVLDEDFCIYNLSIIYLFLGYIFTKLYEYDIW